MHLKIIFFNTISYFKKPLKKIHYLRLFLLKIFILAKQHFLILILREYQKSKFIFKEHLSIVTKCKDLF